MTSRHSCHAHAHAAITHDTCAYLAIERCWRPRVIMARRSVLSNTLPFLAHAVGGTSKWHGPGSQFVCHSLVPCTTTRGPATAARSRQTPIQSAAAWQSDLHCSCRPGQVCGCMHMPASCKMRRSLQPRAPAPTACACPHAASGARAGKQKPLSRELLPPQHAPRRPTCWRHGARRPATSAAPPAPTPRLWMHPSII